MTTKAERAAYAREWRQRSGGTAGARLRAMYRDRLRAMFAAHPERFASHPAGYVADLWRGIVYGDRCTPIGRINPQGYVVLDGRSKGLVGTLGAHRIVWEAANGPIPSDREINHLNGIKHDNRLANLEVVTTRDNILHAYRTGLKSNAGVKHPSNKLSEDQVYEIRARFDAGEICRTIAEDYGVHQRTINDIGHRRSWAHLKEVSHASG